MKGDQQNVKELYLTSVQATAIKKIIRTFKIPKYTVGYALCYYQDIGIDSFHVFCLCLLIAHKVNEDFKIRSSSWSRYTSIDKQWLIDNEIRVLKFFNHQMYLPQDRVVAATLNVYNAFY